MSSHERLCVQRAPWLDCPYAPVSLLDMLKHLAREFYVLAQIVAQVKADPLMLSKYVEEFRIARDLFLETEMPMSKKRLDTIIEGVIAREFEPPAIPSLMDDLQGRIGDELEAKAFYYVPMGKTLYVSPAWLTDRSTMTSAFPSAVPEIRGAGRCYAFGESTASVCMSMRALEGPLGALAAALSVNYDRQNWKNVIDQIEKSIREMGQQNGPDWRQQQKFYAGAAVQFWFIKDAWRNHAMHRHATYDDRGAHEVLTGVTAFMESLAAGGLKE